MALAKKPLTLKALKAPKRPRVLRFSWAWCTPGVSGSLFSPAWRCGGSTGCTGASDYVLGALQGSLVQGLFYVLRGFERVAFKDY